MQAQITRVKSDDVPVKKSVIETKSKLAIVLFSGTVDKLMPVGILASAAATLGMQVDIFATFWGLNAFRKDQVNANTKFSKDYEEMAGPMMQAMKAKHMPSWYEALKQAKEMGNVKVHACTNTYGLLDMKEEDLDPIVDDMIGAVSFLELAREAVTLFI